MSRYIDVDVLLLKIDMHGTNKFGMLDEDIREFIRSIQTSDVAEVLRCKDCKFFCREKMCYREEFGGIVTEEDFCSRGERKDNE